MIHTILTHPGSAHKDDLLAVCVFISIHGAAVVRREPTRADLDDPGVAVIDVGGAHDPSRSNFDHHHFPREHPPTCSLSLVLDALGLYEDALLFCDWLPTAEWFDARGPVKTAAWMGVPRRALSQLDSPIDATLLRRFSRRSALASGDPLYEVMRFIGEDLLDHLRVIRARIAAVGARAERWSVPCGDDLIEAVFLPRADAPTEAASDTIGAWIRANGLEHTVAAIVYPDGRGDGYGVARYEDHPKLDFSRVEGEPDVHFAHVSGFVCKTSATAPARLRALIAGAWRR